MAYLITQIICKSVIVTLECRALTIKAQSLPSHPPPPASPQKTKPNQPTKQKNPTKQHETNQPKYSGHICVIEILKQNEHYIIVFI